jgi:hypothetical protein
MQIAREGGGPAIRAPYGWEEMNIKKDDPVEPGYCEINLTRFPRLLRARRKSAPLSLDNAIILRMSTQFVTS